MSLLSLALSLTTLAAPAALEARISTLLGAPVGTPGGLARPIDPRLRLPDCPGGPSVTPAPDGLSARIGCSAPRWSFVAALARAPRDGAVAAAATPLVRRGDTVRLVVAGQGFVVTRGGVAQGDAAAGASVAVRPDGAAGTLRGLVQSDGTVLLPNPD